MDDAFCFLFKAMQRCSQSTWSRIKLQSLPGSSLGHKKATLSCHSNWKRAVTVKTVKTVIHLGILLDVL